ncbi:MAG: DUF456 family protein [Pirellulales bacterium]|nr:DUF456 family protein [Pirellulales bacterium]
MLGNLLLVIDDAASWWTPRATVVVATLLVVLVIMAWGSNLFLLPGNWIAVMLLALYTWLGPEQGRAAVSVWLLLAALLFALLGEVVEFAASAMGAQKAGASRKSTLYAILGSMIGAVAGALLGLPALGIGSVLAAILLGGLGAAGGAMYGEWSDGKSWRESLPVGQAAFWGRTLGTLGKVLAGMVIVGLTLAGVLL